MMDAFAGIDATFVCLQKDATEAEKAFIPDMATPKLTDFAATASVISTLNKVVTIDSAVAHLAGAMNVPTFILLSTANDWRWGRPIISDREEYSTLYPSAKLFRQYAPGSWQAPLMHIRSRL